jgi:hypothetical protein
MAEQFDRTVGVGATETIALDLPVPGTFAPQTQTFVAAIALKPDPAAAAAVATYVVRHLSSGDEATVPAAPGTAAAPSFSVTLVSLTDGLAIFRINHGSPISPGDEETWEIDLSHGGAEPNDFFLAVDHTQAAVQIPRMSIVIGEQTDPPTPTLDFGLATFNVAKTLSAVVFNTGTGNLPLGAITLSSNPTGFYAISVDPSGTTVSPNGHAPVEVDYTAGPPPPAAPHLATLAIASSAAGVASIDVSITGAAVFREIVLCIDCSNSMNWDNDGNPLASCPVGTTLANNFDPDSRIRQVRAALQSFRSKLIEYGDGQAQLGIVQFPGGDLACGSSHADALASSPATWQETIRPLALFSAGDATVLTHINQATQDGYFHSTPMKAGLQEALDSFSAGNGNFRAVLLFSDGAHNVPANEEPDDLVPTFTNAIRPIRVLSIGFGETGSVDHDLLEDLAVQTKLVVEEDPSFTGFLAYDPTAPGNVDALDTFYTKLFTDIFELQQAVDPSARIARGATNQHKVLITEFDRRVTFSIAWNTPRRELLAFTLVAPNGNQITPNSKLARYYSGPKHKMYAVDIDVLGSSYVGEWTMVVSYAPQTPSVILKAATVSARASSRDLETYSYDAIMRSGLNLKVRFDKTRYHTGDRVVVTAQLTENGRSLLGQRVELQVKRPDEGIGNWYAQHAVSLATIEEAVSGQFGPNSPAAVEHLKPLFKKQFYLKSMQKIPVPGYGDAFAVPVELHDDGQDGDVRAHDGVYTAVLEGLTARPGIYTFSFVATGTTRGGNAFRREHMVHVNVRTRVDFTFEFTKVAIEYLAGEGGLFGGSRQFRAYVRPEDRFGNIWGPGRGKDVVIDSRGARAVTDVVDDLSGGYSRVFEQDATSPSPVVDISVEGRAFPAQAPKSGSRLTLSGCLLPVALLIALIIILLLLARP